MGGLGVEVILGLLPGCTGGVPPLGSETPGLGAADGQVRLGSGIGWVWGCLEHEPGCGAGYFGTWVAGVRTDWLGCGTPGVDTDVAGLDVVVAVMPGIDDGMGGEFDTGVDGVLDVGVAVVIDTGLVEVLDTEVV